MIPPSRCYRCCLVSVSPYYVECYEAQHQHLVYYREILETRVSHLTTSIWSVHYLVGETLEHR